MTQRVVFRPQAEDDALEVRQWYEARREGLGVEFGLAVDELGHEEHQLTPLEA